MRFATSCRPPARPPRSCSELRADPARSLVPPRPDASLREGPPFQDAPNFAGFASADRANGGALRARRKPGSRRAREPRRPSPSAVSAPCAPSPACAHPPWPRPDERTGREGATEPHEPRGRSWRRGKNRRLVSRSRSPSDRSNPPPCLARMFSPRRWSRLVAVHLDALDERQSSDRGYRPPT